MLDGQPVRLPTKKSAALLAFLGIEGDRPRSRGRLADLLWSRSGEAHARQSLRQALFNIRKTLRGLDPFEVDDELVAIRRELVSCDVLELRRIDAGRDDPALVVELCEGELLEGFEIDEPPFDLWLAARRIETREIALRAHMQLVDRQIDDDDTAAAIRTTLALLELDPLSEAAHRKLMQLYVRQGRIHAAMRQYRSLSDTLWSLMRTEPQPETKRLFEQIQTRQNGTDQPATLEGEVNILLVEDNTLQRRLMSEVLQGAGYVLTEVEDGADALLEIGRHPFDLILLDVNLPHVDGIAILETLRRKAVEVPVILVSGVPREEIEGRGLRLGAAEFIQKPVRHDVLLLRVERVLRKSA